MPCPGQCLNVGIDGRTRATKILVSTKNAVIPVWPNECNLQKVHARAPKDLNELSSGTLPFRGRPRPGSTLCQRHPHTLNGRRSGRELRPSGNSHGYGASCLLFMATVPALRSTGSGMAAARQWLSARYHRPGFEDLFDFNVYALCGDGCMMEGISSEAASLAGHW